jgi:glycosyltransferase involved in cell wall biosynthesis
VRILYLHQYFNTPDMTGGTRSYEMARRLVRAGHQVTLLTSERSAARSNLSRWRVEDIDGISVHWLAVPYSNGMGFGRRIRSFGEFAYGAARRAAGLPADLVFATSTPLTIALPAVHAARRQGIRMVLEVRDLWPEVPIAVGALRDPVSQALARRLERFAYRNAARVVALSEGMREGVIRAGYPAERVTVIPNSSDLDLFDVGREPGAELRGRLDWLADRPLVLYMGAFGMIIGVGYLARLAARVRERAPEVRFAAVGTGREEARIREEAERLGVLGVNFFLPGAIPKREAPAWLSAADLATSLVIDVDATWANSANKFFDALAARTPIAVNYGGWQAELLHRTGAGLRLDGRDLDRAAEQLVGAVLDREWLRRAGEAAGRLAEGEFSRDRLAAELEAVLRDAAGDPRDREARGGRRGRSAASRGWAAAEPER